nr:hypothetical protein [Verrucomicrobium spinosum]
MTPEDKDVGEHAMEVVVRDAAGKELERGQTRLRVAPRDAGKGRELKLLIVGDSLTAATAYPNEIARLLSLPENPGWKMYGQHRPASAQRESLMRATVAGRGRRFSPATNPRRNARLMAKAGRSGAAPLCISMARAILLWMWRAISKNRAGKRSRMW